MDSRSGRAGAPVAEASGDVPWDEHPGVLRVDRERNNANAVASVAARYRAGISLLRIAVAIVNEHLRP
jgi:hypothetical protein